MQSAVKFAAYGLFAASFSELGAQALGSASVSDLSNTPDFATVSTFDAIDPTSLLTQSLTNYTTLTSGTVTLTDSTTTVEITVTQVPASEDTSVMVTGSPITESSTAVEAASSSEVTTSSRVTGSPITESPTAVETGSSISSTAVAMETSDPSSVWVSEMEFTSVWKSRVTYSRGGNRTSSTTCTTSSQDAATTTSDVDGVSATSTPEFNSPVSTFSLITGTGTAGTTGGFPSSGNGTYTAPVATSTFNASAISVKMAGANIIGAAAVALAANLI